MDRWSAKPKSNCFSIGCDTGELAFYIPRIQMTKTQGGYRIHFLHNPDRVAWLLSFGLTEIPVAIYRDLDIEQSGNGLGIRPMISDETLRLPGNFDPGPIIDAIRARVHTVK